MDKPLTVRMVQWQPFVTKKPFDPKAPVCASCKRTNRTRSFCRDRNKHRQLPWCTVYVLLTALDQTDPSTIVAAPSQKIESDGEGDSVADESKTNSRDESSVAGSATIGSDADIDSDDINEIAESRTFLVKVSSQGSSIHWLDLADYEAHGVNEAFIGGPTPDMMPAVYPHQPIDPQIPYYAHGMDYSALQHQNALKSHQQYFFQVQQRNQYPPPPTWPYMMHTDQDLGKETANTVGKGGADKRELEHEEAFHALHYQQQQHWAYYGHGHYHPDPGVHGQVDENAEENADRQSFDTNVSTEESDVKRQRVT